MTAPGGRQGTVEAVLTTAVDGRARRLFGCTDLYSGRSFSAWADDCLVWQSYMSTISPFVRIS